MNEANRRALNRANWDERVKIHLAAKSYDLGPLRSGRGKLMELKAHLGHGLPRVRPKLDGTRRSPSET